MTSKDLVFDPLKESDELCDELLEFLFNAFKEEIYEANGMENVYCGDTMKLTIGVEYLPEDK